jgi:hypothetical protein
VRESSLAVDVNLATLADYAAQSKDNKLNIFMVTHNRNDFLILNDAHSRTETPNCGLVVVPYSLPNNQLARIAHRLREWDDAKEAAPGSFGSYVVEFL